jgi:very-short-patch-repair endonuclease
MRIKCGICGSFFKKKHNQKNCDRCIDARPFCACACGQRVKSLRSMARGGFAIPKFTHGHNSRCISVATRVSLRRGIKNFWLGLSKRNRATFVRRRERLMEQRHPDRRKKLSLATKSCFKDPEFVAAWRRACYLRSQSLEYRRTLSVAQKKRYAKMTEREIKAQIQPMLYARARCSRPNKKEKLLNGILQEAFPGQFRLNVRGGVIINGKVPDFVNVNGRKVVIELFGNYWHGPGHTGRSEKAEEGRRKSVFKRYGFSTIVIWERELADVKCVTAKIAKRLNLSF